MRVHLKDWSSALTALYTGVYSDTDTSCILPIALWPGVYPVSVGRCIA